MEIKNIKTFLQIVESGSFTKAAEILGYTQSTVSFQIQQIETELECQLFDRIGRNVALTDRGKLFLQHALKVNNSIEDLFDSFYSDNEIQGTVRMYSSDSICEKMMLLNYFEFYQNYPHIKLIFSTGPTNDMLTILDKNEADIIFTLDEHVYRSDYIIARESLVPLHFFVSKDNPLTKKKRVRIKDLLEYPIILTEKGTSYRKILDEYLATKNIEVEPVLETGRTDIISKTVALGNAITFLPDFIVEDKIKDGTIVRIDVEGVNLFVWKQLIYRKDKWLSNALSAFIDFVKNHEFEW